MAHGESFGAALRRLRMERRSSSLRRFAAEINYSAAYISELERGVKPPTAEVARRCDEALDAGGMLVSLADNRGEGAGRQIGPDGFEPTLLTAPEVAMAVAHESTSGAAADGSRTMPDMSVEQVQDSVRQLARDYTTRSPLSSLLAGRTLRDTARQMADNTNRPGQKADLYQIAGQACGVMAMASFNLAVWPTVVEQARAVLVYAEMIDDRSLQAWARGTLALIAFWSGDASHATHLAAEALRSASGGTACTRLLSISARAWACRGDIARAYDAIEAADRERQAVGEIGTDLLHDRIGGCFGWGPARHALCQASARLRLGEADQASTQARAAIAMNGRDTTGHLVDAKAAADLAAAEVMRDSIDIVEDVLDPVWDISAEYRSHGLMARLLRVRALLGDGRYQNAPSARDIVARIEDFGADSVVQALPSVPARLA